MSTLPTHSAEIFDTLHDLLQLSRARTLQELSQSQPQLSFGQWRLLQLIGSHTCTQKELVERSLMDKAQLTRMLADMEDKNWLLRQTSQSDRRVRELRLSDAGLALYQNLRQQRAAQAQALLQDCPPAMQAQLLALLKQAQASARAHDLASRGRA